MNKPTHFDIAAFRIYIKSALCFISLSLSHVAFADNPAQLVVSPVDPVLVDQRDNVYFADFGRAAFGNLQVHVTGSVPAGTLTVRLGEKLAANGTIDRSPRGSVNFRQISLSFQPQQQNYQLTIPTKPFHKGAASVKMPPSIGEITPFRYIEIEGAADIVRNIKTKQMFVHAPFDDLASWFESSDETLNAVWHLCKYTIKATTCFGVYIDGERERIPYEADAYINQLSHYAVDLNPDVARRTIGYLLKHPTWPTEWSLHMPMMAAADYQATGDISIARDYYEKLKKKLLMNKAGEDGLLRASGIVDWPAVERDGYNDGVVDPAEKKQVGPQINTVVNAFYYHALQQMSVLAHALNKKQDASDFDDRAARIKEVFNNVFFDSSRGIYIDGVGSSHASLHANMFPMAFGLVPENNKKTVSDYIQSRGMACSVYGAQYLLEALFDADMETTAIRLMTARTQRSWWHMIELGSTMTLEAWDPAFKPNLTWNHAWGAAPANIITRYVLGVRPLTPGYGKILIAPQPGELKWARGQIPTAKGPVTVCIENTDIMKLTVELPAGAAARIILPKSAGKSISHNGKFHVALSTDSVVAVDVDDGGTHTFVW